ncbi:hypothetical protein BHE90_005643 [Fusarium euwallaceae]|uniref:Uncharacterized protein n=2 Tax=Fusarium solani species complex TaxID=232080 RepID=A0A3M2RSP4_9HYPO|nr:hypothetical protein CDV36_012036 [Fusarium kuroshium]RTE79880.1 hypothetical protein BHE90_005643 [Fusarium euwallaceae]
MDSQQYLAEDTASLQTIRLYETISLTLFAGGLIYVYRSRNPLFYGAYLASSVGGGVMEWVFDSKYYFRLTTDDRFYTAWTMAGEKAALAMVLFYAFFFGIPLVLLHDYRSNLYATLGRPGTYVAVAVLGFVGTPMFECTNTSVTHIYKYHQKEEYLFHGMPYSNLWFGAMMMMFPFWALDQANVLLKLVSRAGLSVWEQRMLACELGFASVISAFFVAATVNGVWYCMAGDVWMTSPRLF